MNRLPANLAAKITEDATGCWLWTGARQSSGYGCASIGGGRNGLAHRVIYELLVGPIPSGLQVDHLCRVRLCVNPEHLEPVTAGENVRRSVAARFPMPTRPPAESELTLEAIEQFFAWVGTPEFDAAVDASFAETEHQSA